MKRRDPQTVLRWTFSRGKELLTCVVHRRSGAFRVSLVPHAVHGLSAVHTSPSIFGALQRHAAIAARLRQEGWDVVSYSGATPRTPEFRTLPEAA